MHNLAIAGATSVIVGMWTYAAAISFAPLGDTEVQNDLTDIRTPDLNLLAAYQDCSREAEDRLLSLEEATRCSETYLLLKLSFFPEIDIAEFKALPPKERWEIQQRGYAALVTWREKQIGF